MRVRACHGAATEPVIVTSRNTGGGSDDTRSERCWARSIVFQFIRLSRVVAILNQPIFDNEAKIIQNLANHILDHFKNLSASNLLI